MMVCLIKLGKKIPSSLIRCQLDSNFRVLFINYKHFEMKDIPVSIVKTKPTQKVC